MLSQTPHFCLPSFRVLPSSGPSPLGDDHSQGQETGGKGVTLGKHASWSSGPLVPCAWHRPRCPVAGGAITGQTRHQRPPGRELLEASVSRLLKAHERWTFPHHESLGDGPADGGTLVTERAHRRNLQDPSPVGVPGASGTSLHRPPRPCKAAELWQVPSWPGVSGSSRRTGELLQACALPWGPQEKMSVVHTA